MPYKDPEDKKKQMKKWRGRVMKDGYGKWLYARRKLRFDDADRFRRTLEAIISTYDPDDHRGGSAALMHELAKEALRASAYAEAELGHFHGQNFGESDADLS